MLATNNTPFAALGFEKIHRDGMPMAVVAVRATYELNDACRLSLAKEQSLVYADEYNGNPQTTGLVRVGDFSAYRPNTDITVIGRTYAPSGKSASQWTFGVSINHNKRLLWAHGLRDWIPDGKRDGKPHWRMGEVKPVDFVPLDYRYAAGSRVYGQMENDPHGLNPIGAYLIDPAVTPADATIPVAMIDSESCPVIDPFTPATPQGLSPIPLFWAQRRMFVGTRDKEWQENHFPNFPKDFDYLFYQAASRGLIARGYLKGDETIKVHNLMLGGGEMSFQLPAIQPYARFNWLDGRAATAKLNLDGVHIDMRALKAPWRVDLTWRGWATICPQFFNIELFQTELDDPKLANCLVCNESGLNEPTPIAVINHGDEKQ